MAAPVLSTTSVSSVEGNSGSLNVTITLNLDSVPTTPVTLQFYTQDGTAGSGVDYFYDQGGISFSTGATSDTFNVAIAGDLLIEGDESFSIVLTSIQGAVFTGGAAALVLTSTILDNDNGPAHGPTTPSVVAIMGPASASLTLPTVAVHDVSIIEGNSSYSYVTFLVTVDHAPTTDITLDFYLQDGSASKGLSDYQAGSGTLVINAGETSTFIRTAVYGDTIDESDETFQIVLTNISGGVFANNSAAIAATATIIDNDGGAPDMAAGVGGEGIGLATAASSSVSLPTLTVNSVSQIEGDASYEYVYFLVTLDKAPTTPVSVDWYLQDGSASSSVGNAGAGSDYQAGSGTLNFDAGQTSAWIRTAVYGDTSIEANETFQLVLTNVSGAVLAGNAASLVAGATILDNDDGSIDSAAGIGASATQIAGPADASPALPTLTIHNASIIEGNSSYEYVRFLVTLDSPATAPVTVHYYLQDGSASAALGDYQPGASSLTFDAGQQSGYITVAVYGDLLNENNETFQIVLTDVEGAVFSSNASAMTATATIVDNDGGAPDMAAGVGGAGQPVAGPASASGAVPTMVVSDVTHIEGNSGYSYVRFLVTLSSAPTAPVSVDYYFQDGSASGALGDYDVGASTLNFAAGQTSAYITTAVYGDVALEGNETFDLVLTGVHGAVFTGNAPALIATATILDNDTGAVNGEGGIGGPADQVVTSASASGSLPTISISDVTQIEGNGGYNYVRFLVTLDSAPTTNVRFDYYFQDGTASSANGDYDPGNGQILLTAGERSAWVQTVIYGDNLIENNETFDLVLANAQGAVFAGGAASLSATATILDNDNGQTGLSAGVGSLGSANWQPVSSSNSLPTVSVSDVTQIEGNAGFNYMRFLVTLDHAPTAPVTFRYNFQDGTASGRDGDYDLGSGIVTLQAGQTSTWITTAIYGDTLIEPNETFQVVLSGITGGVFAGNAAALVATGTILDNDNGQTGQLGGIGDDANHVPAPPDAPGVPVIRVVSVGINEGDSSASSAGVYLLLSHASNANITLKVSTADGTAQAASPSDYGSIATQTVTITAGLTSVWLPVTVYGDTVIEPDQTFTVTFSQLNGAVFEGGAPSATATVTIFDDDGTGTAGTSMGGPQFILSPSAGADFITGTTFGETLSGLAGNDTILGGAGNDTLNGGAGADSMDGGAGLDIADYSGSGAAVTIDLNAGAASGGDAQGDVIVGIEGVIGSAFADTLTGSSAANWISGSGGADTINGGIGADTMLGGVGNDVFYIDNAGDIVTENVGEGTLDTIRSTVGIATLAANVENLELLGAAVTGNGNELNNRITGNASNNSINGGLGADTMLGGSGNDTYFVDNAGDLVNESAGQGTDTIFSTVDVAALAANVENLTVSGAALNGTGNNLNNVITGNSNNNQLYGASGEDTLQGGLGNDTYIVNSAGDVVIDTGGNSDTILSYLDVAALNADIENLTLAGTAITGVGNALNNNIVGTSADNVLTGGAGNDSLTGSVGADTMNGGTGDDAFLVENVGDVVNENAGEGTDIVYAFISISSLAANVEKLTLMPAGGVIDGVANGLDNRLNGNDSANTLSGLGGADVIQGLAGNDHIIGGGGLDNIFGGAGNDVYVYQAVSDSGVTGATRDVINDFVHGEDTIDLSAIDAVTGGSDNAFTLIGTGAFTHVAGQLRYDLIDASGTANDFTVISMDVNGDGVTDSQITLKGLVSLVNADFVL